MNKPDPTPKKPTSVDWHRLFGLALQHEFTGKPFHVHTEVDLSIKQQFLDVIIVQKEEEVYEDKLPDGLDNLAKRNLLSYKSLRESLDAWALDELIGHYVNYRKQVSPKDNLLPQTEFRLYAVCTRFPQGLDDRYTLTYQQDGVYDLTWGSHQVRVIVLSRILPEAHNAMWNLFSNVRSNVAYGADLYREQPQTVSSVINYLFQFYNLEGLYMPYTMDDLNRDAIIDFVPEWVKNDELRDLLLETLSQELLKQQPVLQYLYKPQQAGDDAREGFIKTIERILRLRFQVDIDAYRPQLETLSPAELDRLGELAETADTLAQFEARLSQ